MTREEKQKTIDTLKISAPVITVTQKEFEDYIQTLNKIMDWIEQQPCTDTISREAVIDIIEDVCPIYGNDYRYILREKVNELPPVNPAEKVGQWRHYEGMLICSECGAEFYDDIMEYCGDDVPKYCPDCGEKMQEVEE